MSKARGEQFSAADRALLKAAGADGRFKDCAELTVPALRELALREGMDFATAVAYDRVLRKPRNQVFFDEVGRSPDCVVDRDVLFAIVPGAFYRMHKHSGADGARLIRILETAGRRVETIPIENFGRVRENARIIAEWLEAKKREKVVILSLSKGSADVKCALRERPNLGRHLLGWVSLSGISSGTPLVDWLQRQRWQMLGIRFFFWWRGLSLEALNDLQSGGELNDWGDAADELPLLNVCGFPLQRHLAHRWAPKGYRRLAPLGPNDGGGILLGEVAQRPGLVFPVWGADHYLAPSWDCDAQLRTVLALASAGALRARQANLCEA
jgi:hypothetical protein